jgi:hypothetical protein
MKAAYQAASCHAGHVCHARPWRKKRSESPMDWEFYIVLHGFEDLKSDLTGPMG